MQQDVSMILSTGQPVRVELNDRIGKVSCHQAVIGSVENGVIELLFELSELPILSLDSEIILAFQKDPEGVDLFYRARVTDVYFGKAAIYISDLKPVDITALRKHFRCDVSFPVKLDTDTKIFWGHAKNLSVGGMLVGMPAQVGLAVGLRLTCHFNLPWVGTPLVVRSEIVRIERINKERIGIALRYLSLHEKNQNDIIQYLYRCQREMMRNRDRSK